MPDLGLGLLGDADGLGVAAALDVEDRVLCPAVLVVANEQTSLGGRKRGLAGAREAKEDRGAVRLRVHVAGAVHGEHVLLNGEQVVHDREDGLLDLAGVLRAGDENNTLLEVDDDRGLGMGVVHRRVELEARARHDHEVRAAVVGKLLLGGAHEHLVRKERLAGKLGQDQDLARVAPVGTRDAVDHEDATLGEVRDDLIVNELVVLLGEGHVNVTPGNLVVDVGGVHDEAVLWRAARVLARGDRKCARAGENALPARDGLLDQPSGRRVYCRPVIGVVNTILLKFLNYHADLLGAAYVRRTKTSMRAMARSGCAHRGIDRRPESKSGCRAPTIDSTRTFGGATIC